MKINISSAHNPDGMVACGAVGFKKESTESRRIVSAVKEKLRSKGHTVYDCTCDNGTSQSDVLKKIVSKCNMHSVDLDVSIHLNASDNVSANGTEVLVYKSNSKALPYAHKIVDSIAELGYKNRGVKVRNDLYFLKKTNAPALLIECFFVTSASDCAKYTVDSMANAIVKGILGIDFTSPTYKVKVVTDVLNIREKPSALSKKVGQVYENGVYTIVEEQNGWGHLKSGAGWIKLSYTVRI